MPFNVGPGEIIIILIIALIVVGPGKLPDVGSALGKSIREFRKAATDVKESTSLEAPKGSPAPSAPAPAAPAAPPASVVTRDDADAPAAERPAEATTGAPPVPAIPAVPAAPSGSLAAAAAVETAANEADAPDAGAPERQDADASGGAWPTEVTPVDEQQPTASA